jgi:hypothetical protein
MSLQKNPIQAGNQTRVKWHAPPIDILKVNIDGAFMEKEKIGAWSYVVRSSNGQAIMAGAGKMTAVHDVVHDTHLHLCLRNVAGICGGL